MLRITVANQHDAKYVYDALGSLRDGVDINYSDFENYYHQTLKNTNLKYIIGIIESDIKVGLVTLNRFEIPRYAGYGYEMEEVTVLQEHQGKGYATKIIELIIEQCKTELNCRKLLVKTNSNAAIELYKKTLHQTSLIPFQLYINKYNG